jgi:hypothetical protein
MIIGVDIIKYGKLLVDGELFSFNINILKWLKFIIFANEVD